MKKLPILRYLASAILPFLAMASAANGALVLYYNFDSDTGANGSSAINSAGGTNGTYRQGTTTPIGTTTLIASQAGVFGTNSGTVGGKALSLTPNNNGDENVAPPHIDTNAAASVFGFINAVNSDYTAMAWVRFANQTGDNMVFGQGDGNRLHLGSRGNQYWSGHWNDDLGAGGTDTGNWHHVAWTNANNGTQEIFVDGTSIGTRTDAIFGEFNSANNLLIGTSGNSGSFSGLIDEVKVFDTRLTAAEIQAASVIVPEPGAVILGLFGVAGLLLRRRR